MNGLDIYEAMNGIDEKYINEALDETNNKKHRLNKWQRWAISAVATIVLVFVSVVNLFPSVAYAMSDVILLGDLARAVTFDSSMRACLENEYAQYVGEEYTTPEGYHSKVYYMVVDPSRISIFYKSGCADNYDSENTQDIVDHFIEVSVSGEEERSWMITKLDTDIKGLYEARVDISTGEIFNEFEFEIQYYGWTEPEKVIDPFDGEEHETSDTYDISKAVYTLRPDSKYTTVVDHYEINEKVEVAGQYFTVDALDVYPTQARLYISPDEENSKLITEIDAVIIDDKGREYVDKSNGLRASYDEDENVKVSYYESSYFVKTKSLKVVIRQVDLLDKDKQFGDISLENKTIDNMPEGVLIDEMRLNDDGGLVIKLKASNKSRFYNGEAFYQPCDVYNKEDREVALGDGVIEEFSGDGKAYFLINNFEEGKYQMIWKGGKWTKIEEPIEISVK